MTAPAATFDVNCVRLRVDDAGGSGLPVMFQHGLCGDARQTAEAFPADGRFRRITLECRGHGSSETGELSSLSIAAFAADAGACIEKLEIGPIVVGGISMGAAIALRLAVMRPDLVRGLIIARPAWLSASAPANMRPNAEAGHLMANHAPRDALAKFMAGETAKRLAIDGPDNLASLKGFFSREPIEVTSALLLRISADGPGVTDDDIRAIQVPSLIIGNDRDAVHPLAFARTIAGMIPQARLAEITAKADDRVRYLRDFQHVVAEFLEEFL